ncbi:MAG TPA: hypothetical protein VK280_24205, partial [Streptosporangiaceae bacterium]|nr:hypothetical protein [Streptosporangiaceae bacterium]
WHLVAPAARRARLLALRPAPLAADLRAGAVPALWSVVFPLGMYSVATLVFGKAARLAFMGPLARFMLWVAITAWAMVAAAFLARLTRQPGEPVPGPPTAPATRTSTAP